MQHGPPEARGRARITEADARVLEFGSTIVLVAGGHVTPLAQDTLRARRISVVREGTDPDSASLAPTADIRTVAIAGDHSSLALKSALVQHLRGRGLAVRDLGTMTSDPCTLIIERKPESMRSTSRATSPYAT